MHLITLHYTTLINYITATTHHTTLHGLHCSDNNNYYYHHHSYNCNYTTLITLQHSTNSTTTTQHYAARINSTLQLQLQLQLPLHYIALHYTTTTTTLHYTRLHYTIPHNSTVHYTTLITPHHSYNCNYTTLLHYITTTTPLHYTTTTTTLHHTTSSSCGEVTTATIATTPENTTPTTFRSISGFALPSTTTNLSYRFPIIETSATALHGTTGMSCMLAESNIKTPKAPSTFGGECKVSTGALLRQVSRALSHRRKPTCLTLMAACECGLPEPRFAAIMAP